MIRSNCAALIAALVALLGVGLGAYGLYRSTTTERNMVAMSATAEE